MVLLRAMGSAVGEAAATSRSKAELRTVQLPVQKLTADSFRAFGQVSFFKQTFLSVLLSCNLVLVPDSALAAGHLCK